MRLTDDCSDSGAASGTCASIASDAEFLLGWSDDLPSCGMGDLGPG